MKNWDQIREELKAPFATNVLKFRAGGGGKQLAYIDARAVMKRLDDVVGIENWQCHYEDLSGRVICRLSIRVDGEWITKCDGAGDTKIEGEKGGISDALKRAAVLFGVGRYLYYLPAGTTVNNLPAWAVATMKYTAEAGHWYTRDGEPAYTYLNRDGVEKNTTLRQARERNLVPSVTTILNIADKPGLNHWKALQTIQATKDIRRSDYEDEGSHLKAVLRESKRVGREAAERGTEIHAMVEKGFKGGFKSPAYLAVLAVLNEIFPGESWQAEESFCSESGYGGKIDLCSKAGVFVDFKTKEGLAEKSVKSLIFDEHGMQLSAYAHGKKFINPERVSIFIDRDDPTIIRHHVWDREGHDRHLQMFKCLLSYWQLRNNYAN